MLLTIGMMVKNEEKHLAECLSSLDSIREELDSELVIVDTGSDDNTVEIAKKYTDKVYFHEWNDNFSEMRNTVIDYAKGEWYFSLDGDEIINNPETIINFFKSSKHQKYNSGLVTQKNYTNLEENRFSKILVPRLFKNDKDFCFKGAVHNQPQYKKPVYGLDTILDHYGYVSSDEALIERKFQRTSNILKQELEKDPTNVYYWFQLSKSYNMHKDQEDALDAIEEAYKVARENDLDLSIRMYILIQLVKMYLINNRHKMAEKIAKNALAIKDGYVDLYYYLARAQLLQGKKEKSLNSFKKYITLIANYDQTNSKRDTSVDDETMGNYNISYRFIIALAADLEIETDYAINSAFKIDIDSQLQHVVHPFISICLNNKRYKDLKEFYLKQLENNNSKKRFINLLEKLKSNLIIEEKKKVDSIFTDLEDNTEYNLLNKVRKNLYQDNYTIKLEELEVIDYNNQADYYGDIIYYLLKSNESSVYKILTSIREKNLNRFIKYLNEKYDDLSESIIKFIDLEIEGVAEARVNKSLSRYLLALDNDIDMEQDSKEIIDNYLSAGLQYIEKIYTEVVIENELIYELKNKEEMFLLYMRKAFAIKDSDLKTYIKYLRKAIDIYPLMKKVVETLLLEIKEEQDKVNEELEAEKNKFKSNIEELINRGSFTEANELIEEYKKQFDLDAETYSMYGVLLMKMGEFDEALTVLQNGAQIYNNDTDILFNLGYLNYELGNNENAKFYLEQAKLNSSSNKIRNDINSLLNNLNNKSDPVSKKMTVKDFMNFENDNNKLLKYRFEFDNLSLWTFVRWKIFFRVKQLNYNTQQPHGQGKLKDRNLYKKEIIENNFDMKNEFPIIYFGNSRNTIKKSNGKFYNSYYDDFVNIFPEETLVLENANNYKHNIPRDIMNYGAREYINLLINREVKDGDKSEGKIVSEFIKYLMNKFPVKFRDEFYDYLTNGLLDISKKLRATKKVYKKIFKKLDSEIIIFHAAHYMTEPHIIKWANEENIVTAELQHGFIGSSHFGYNFGNIFFNTELKKYLPKYLLTYGKYWNKVHTPSKRYVVGKPYLNHKINNFNKENKKDKRIILVVSQGTVTEKLVSLTNQLSKIIDNEYKIIYRLHPGEVAFKNRYSSLKGKNNIEVDHSSDIFHLIEISDYIVGHNSTTIFEALPFKKPTFVLETEESRDYIPNEIANWFKNAQELFNMIQKNNFFVNRRYNKFWAKNSLKRYKKFIQHII